MGESYGPFIVGNDQAILPYITSANIACGFHGGDPAVMEQTLIMAFEHQVKIGAHPGLPDLQGFGRRNMDISPREAYQIVVYQIGALQAFVTALGGEMNHVKPHGALYNMAAKNKNLAEAIAEAIYKVNPELILYGLAGSHLVHEGERIGLSIAHEVFADRTYQRDGSLTPRSYPQALIHDSGQAIAQVVSMIKEGKVIALSGEEVPMKADTLCIHGDGAHALIFAELIRKKLTAEGIQVK
jgi:UPF0271 protein